MILLGQLTGVNAIMYYMSVLMNQIGFNQEDATYMSLVGGGSLLIGTIPAIFLMETCGRRFWAIMMLPGFFVGLVLIGVAYQIPLDTNLKAAEGLYLAGLIIYMGFFGSYACLTWGKFYFLLSLSSISTSNFIFSGTIRSLSNLSAKLRHDNLRCTSLPRFLHRHLQLLCHGGSYDTNWSHARILRWYCLHRRTLPNLLHAGDKG